MLDTVKIYMKEWQGIGQGEEYYAVMGMIELVGMKCATVRDGKEAAVKIYMK